MLRNYAYGGLALIGGAITGIAISSWATPTNPPQVASEVVHVAAQPPLTLASTSLRTANDATDCSPWDVSDVAMEAALKEMIRRGWRPPSQAEIVASYDFYGSPTVQSAEPDALVPVRQPAVAAATPEASSGALSFPVEQIQPTSEAAPIAQTPVVSEPAPPPAPVAVEPTPPSN